MKGKPTKGRRRFQMLHVPKKVMAMPYSSKQLKKGRMEIQWHDTRNLLYSRLNIHSAVIMKIGLTQHLIYFSDRTSLLCNTETAKYNNCKI